MKLPAGSAPALPVAVDLHESFADYHAAYSFADGTLHAERRLTTKVTEIPVGADRSLSRIYKSNHGRRGYLHSADRGGSSVSSTSIAAPRDFSQGTPEALAFIRETQNAAQRGDAPAALDAAQHAVDADPQFSFGWLVLGSMQVTMRQEDQGVASLKKAIALNASDPTRYEPVAAELVRSIASSRPWRSGGHWNRGPPDDTNPPLQIAKSSWRKQILRRGEAKELEPVAQKNPDEEVPS